jgi:hypothetical protein
MESQAIKEYNDFTGTNGYLIVDGLDEQTPGGKKLLSELSGSNVPNYPTDVATSDTKRYHLAVGNKAGDLQVGWEDETYYDVANNGGLAKASGGDTISFSIDTKHANDGDVLTYHKNGSTDEVVWTAPGGGGSSLPEYTTDDENKVLGVFVDRVWDKQSSKYVITDTRLGWREGIPEFPNLGSGGEWGVEPVVKLSYKYNDEIGEYEMSSEAGFAGCPYNTFGENGDAQYGTWRFKEWNDYGDYPYSVVNNTYVAEIDNNWFINFGYLRDGYDPDPEYSEPKHPDANSILFKVKHHGAVVPFVCIEFINESGKSLTVSVESEETGGDFGETMVPITDNGVSVNKVIPNNTFVQITVLGHGYTIKTQSTELPVH